jgi:hypothetical protein
MPDTYIIKPTIFNINNPVFNIYLTFIFLYMAIILYISDINKTVI